MNEEKNKLTTTESSDEPKSNCLFCGNKGEFELDDGRFICDTCAQIQGELSKD